MTFSRREFIKKTGMAAAGYGLASMVSNPLMASSPKAFTFDISLAEFSFASELYGGKMTNIDFPFRAVNEFGINVLEYVSGFFNNKHTDAAYMNELKSICDDLGAVNHLIMIDGDNIAALNDAARKKAVEGHYIWMDAAKFLGCTAVRVNLGDPMAVLSGKPEEGSPQEVAAAAADGYGRLLEYGEKLNLNVIIENHFGYSTDPDWLVGIMKQVKSDKKGFLPDFGNFCAERTKPESADLKSIISTTCVKEFDKYDGVAKLMPYAKAISAKTHIFDANGNDLETDFTRMFKIIKESGWSGGYVGIEYEGGLMRDMGGMTHFLSNSDGIKATKKLLEKIKEELK